MKEKVSNQVASAYLIAVCSVLLYCIVEHVGPTSVFCYAIVVFCVIFTLFTLCPFSNIRYVYYSIAMILTLIADTILVLKALNVTTTTAMCVFTGAQLSYCIQMHYDTGVERKIAALTVRLLSTLILISISFVVIKQTTLQSLVLVTLVYFSQLALNLFYAVHYKSHPFLSVGFLLFVLCDISIGIGYLYQMKYISHEVIAVIAGSSSLTWTFYAPSQVCLALHSTTIRQRRVATCSS